MFLKFIRNNKNDISINEANEILNTNLDSILLDIRNKKEYKEGHLKRSSKYTII